MQNDFQDSKKSAYFSIKITNLFMKIDRIYRRRDPLNLVYASAEAREYGATAVHSRTSVSHLSQIHAPISCLWWFLAGNKV